MVSVWTFLRDGYSVQKCDLREGERKIAWHPSEAASPNAFHQLSPALLFAEWEVGAGVGIGALTSHHSSGLCISRNKTQVTLDSITEETHYASMILASSYAVHHSSAGIASPLQIRKLRPECSHSRDTNTFLPFRSDHGPTPSAAHPNALLLSRGQFPHPQRKLQKGDHWLMAAHAGVATGLRVLQPGCSPPPRSRHAS